VRRIATALVATLALGIAGSGLASDEAKRPRLQILDTSPLTVRGTSFEPGERVKLLVGSPKPLSKSVRAGSRGGFVARFALQVAHGEAVVVQAIGSRGSRAMTDITTPHGTRP
jgi:hypothetical protein